MFNCETSVCKKPYYGDPLCKTTRGCSSKVNQIDMRHPFHTLLGERFHTTKYCFLPKSLLLNGFIMHCSLWYIGLNVSQKLLSSLMHLGQRKTWHPSESSGDKASAVRLDDGDRPRSLDFSSYFLTIPIVPPYIDQKIAAETSLVIHFLL